MALEQKNRRRNAVAKKDDFGLTGPPAVVQAATLDIVVRTKKVGKSGAVYLSALPEGSNVNVATVDSQTFLVSSRPAAEVRALTASIPKSPTSPFAALSAEVRGQKHDLPTARVRSAYPGPIGNLEIPENDESGLDLTRAKRLR